MKEYKATDPEMVQAQKDLAKMSNLSDRVITNDQDLFEELATIQKKLCQISEPKFSSPNAALSVFIEIFKVVINLEK